ncbi:MAG: arginine--tRNA ligase [Bacteroidales bacterium]|nr:arginine--tRNA ligase [Bacteroidales bacterium]
MQPIESIIFDEIKKAVETVYNQPVVPALIQLQATRKEFDGDITAVMFPLLKMSRKSPEQTGEEIGAYLKEKLPLIDSYQVIKGFLNLKFSPAFWLERMKTMAATPQFGQHPDNGKTIMVEYSSPNTNKPLHLGHIRNNLLGWSVSKLLEANGYKVMKVNLVNDRGVHICKSMIAWQRSGHGETPLSSGIKGDHLVGKYYVLFDQAYKSEIEALKLQNVPQEVAEKEAPVLSEAHEMLRKWEQGDPATIQLWETMNSWVYEGFDATYKRLGVSFDKIYYESQTYLLGKSLVQEGLDKGVLYQKEDGSVWCDLTGDGLDHKLLLRADGTSVYMTQDLGTAQQRYQEFPSEEMIYVVGNEQNYHFQVLRLILKKMGFAWADSIYHLSYGMVELPQGKMKSREGTVVDADDLMEGMVQTARETSIELGKLEEMPATEREELFEMLGLGALKYFILKVDPKKTMLFDPKESIDFNGNTGPFIQYTHARIKSVLRKAGEQGYAPACTEAPLLDREVSLIKTLNDYPERIKEAGMAHSPAIVANYAFELAKEFNQFYHEVSVLKEPNQKVLIQRLLLLEQMAKVLTHAMDILGIKLPDRM